MISQVLKIQTWAPNFGTESRDEKPGRTFPAETKNGDHAFSLEEIRRNPQRGAVGSYLVRFRLGVKRGIMNS